MKIHVTKADGTLEYFKVEKLRRSLRRAGAAPQEVNRIVEKVTDELFEGMKTQEIYRRAFLLLRERKQPAATRYSLRRALFSLGPTGFPFEKFLSRMFTKEGYHTKTGVVLQGNCAPHEIDISAYNDTHSFVGEAKFHARPGIKTDLQVAMYSYARLLDLQGQHICQESVCGIKEFWLITNTKFTTTAEKYGECMGLKMLSWDYPRRNNLHDTIQRLKIYPITVLQTLTMSQITILINKEIIICEDLIKNPVSLNHLNLSSKKQQAVLDEVEEVCRFRK